MTKYPRHRAVESLFFALLLFGYHVVAHADAWPSTYHDPANTCLSSETIRLPLTLAWRMPNINGQIVSANHMLFVSSGTSGCVALRVVDGTQVWKLPGNYENAYLKDGTLYAINRLPQDPRSHLLAIDAMTGDIHWDVQWEGEGYELSQRLTGITGYQHHLFILNEMSQLVEFNPANGSQVRMVQFPSWSMGMPAFAGEYAFWGGEHMFTTLSLTKWKTTTWGIWDGGNSYPIVWKDYLAIQGPINTTQVYRLQDGTPSLLHRYYGLKGIGHGIAPVGHGLLLSRSDNPAGYLMARDLDDGKTRWQVPMDVTTMCSATAEYVYVCGRNRERDSHGRPLADKWQYALFVVRARDGRISAKYLLPSFSKNPPVITDGHVIVAVANEIRCYTSAN